MEVNFRPIRQRLIVFSSEDYQGHPPYWVKIFQDYIKMGLIDEAMKTGHLWKAWYKPFQTQQTRINGDLWFLSIFSIFEIAAGNEDQRLDDLKLAYEMQLQHWKEHPNYANNFQSFISCETL